MSAHTPGPWRLRRTRKEAPDDMIVMDEPGSGICDCSPGNPDITVEEAMANARLIAAAPEMLDALKALCSWITDEVEIDGCEVPAYAARLKAAQSAIAKAEGRT